MTDQHRATPEQWASPADLAFHGDPGTIIDRRLRQLHARVEALEAMATTRSFKIDTSKWSDEQRQQFLGELSEPTTLERFTDPRFGAPTPAPAPADSLVERVAMAINPIDGAPLYLDEARAAIRVVAAWLREKDPEPGAVGRWLGQISTPCSVIADELERKANQ
jgi:hypothetical protein